MKLLRVIPQVGARGDRHSTPLCNTDTDSSHRRELLKQALRNNQCFIVHKLRIQPGSPAPRLLAQQLLLVLLGLPVPHQPKWTGKEELEALSAGNHRAWESCLLCFQLRGMLPRSPQSTRGICQVLEDLLRQPACQGYTPEPQTSQLTRSHEIRHEACQNPSHAFAESH